jgi:hypothetical protein
VEKFLDYFTTIGVAGFFIVMGGVVGTLIGAILTFYPITSAIVVGIFVVFSFIWRLKKYGKLF